jgi:hypothetical protein
MRSEVSGRVVYSSRIKFSKLDFVVLRTISGVSAGREGEGGLT